MSQTDNLSLPFILASQAQKHVTHNEALLKLDAIVQLSCASRSQSSPPTTPSNGARYLIPNGASGDFLGHDDQIAAYQDGVFQYFTPQTGWRAMIEDEVTEIYFNGSAWIDLNGSNADLSANTLGISATADSTNKFSLSADASLFNNAGSGHQVKINKAAAGDTASLLFQTGFSGRAEFGLSGDDQFRIKVSSDGSNFNTALEISVDAIKIGAPLELPNISKNALPNANPVGQILFVSDATGGSIVAFSDGSNWRRMDSRAIVS